MLRSGADAPLCGLSPAAQLNKAFQAEESPAVIYCISMQWFREWEAFVKGKDNGEWSTAPPPAPSTGVPPAPGPGSLAHPPHLGQATQRPGPGLLAAAGQGPACSPLPHVLSLLVPRQGCLPESSAVPGKKQQSPSSTRGSQPRAGGPGRVSRFYARDTGLSGPKHQPGLGARGGALLPSRPCWAVRCQARPGGSLGLGEAGRLGGAGESLQPALGPRLRLQPALPWAGPPPASGNSSQGPGWLRIT